ncbi:MAG: amidohydrolase family protein [Alistipes sp.]|nr:amidohydrolase family protein [Alistipes sp.]
MKRRIASHFTLINGHLERNIIVDIDTDGTILAVQHYDNIDSEAHVEFFPGILIPGMVNAHCHLELAYLQGAIAEGGGYATFASEIGRVRGNFSNEERLHAASVADAMMWEQGIEVVADIANDDLVMSIKERSHIEYHTMFEFFGLNNHNTTPLEQLADKYPNASVTPHSTYSVQEQEFRHICDKYSPLLSLHFLESENEALLYQHKGSLAEWYGRMGWECEFLHYGTPAQRVANCVPANSRLLLVHATCATKEDVATVEGALQGGATWVLCLESNRYISNLCPPVEMLETMGARIAIGTDSLASARRLSMVDNMRLLGDRPLEQLLTYATINGAKALGIEATKGSIDVGKRPGLVIVEGVDYATMRLTPDSHTYRLL